ncbi:MAG: hypothetical protein MJ133_09165 [Lachnospiraceae bacterium]|nr:hypothetical protein [Lachnospiraceae bacterium]
MNKSVYKRTTKYSLKHKRTVSALIIMSIFLLTACSKEPEPEPEVKETKIEVEMNYDFIPTDESVPEEERYHYAPAVLEFWVPDGFEAAEGTSQYLYKTYPKDVSSIDHLVSNETFDVKKINGAEYKASIQADIQEAYGDEIEINITRFTRIEIDKRPGLWVEYEYDFRDDHYKALDVVIYNGDEMHFMYYLQGAKADWMNDFIKSANSIIITDK